MRLRRWVVLSASVLTTALPFCCPIISEAMFPGAKYPGGRFTVASEFGDFNSDGVLDLAMANWSSDDVTVYFGHGDGTFDTGRTISVGESPHALVVADFNGDGVVDIAVINKFSTDVSVLIGSIGGTFDQVRSATGHKYGEDLAVGDLNGDGIPDLVMANGLFRSLSIMIGNGDGSFQHSLFRLDRRSLPMRVALGDVDDDGVLDVMAAIAGKASGSHPREASLALFRGIGNGSLAPREEVAFFKETDSPVELVLADVDRDNRLDTVVGLQSLSSRLPTNGDRILVLKGDGAAGFNGHTTLRLDVAPLSVAVADWNGDGRPDLGVARHGLLVYQAADDGGFAEDATFYPAGKDPRWLTTGDIDGDGDIDVALPSTAGGSIVLVNTGDGTFVTRDRYISFRGGRRDIGVADLDDDGWLDVAILGYQDVIIMRGSEDGRLVEDGLFPLPPNPQAMSLGDFNMDGIEDVAVVSRGRSFPPILGKVSVLLGRGDATFTDRENYAVGTIAQAIGLGDATGDGTEDIVTANAGHRRGPPDLSLLRGKGDGSFEPDTRIPLPATARSVHVEDVSGDGIADILTAEGNAISPTGIRLFEGPADPIPGPDTVFPLDPVAYSIVVAELNGDGTADLVVPGPGRYSVIVLLGHGAGRFDSPAAYEVGRRPIRATARDFNADGTVDLAVISMDEDDVSVLLGKGDGSFHAEQRFDVGADPASIEGADMNGDGAIDIVVGLRSSEGLAVLFNQHGCPREDDSPPTVSLTEPEGGIILTGESLLFELLFESSDEDEYRGDVEHERVFLSGCLLFDGDEYGNKDGLLSDEFLDTSPTHLCRAMDACSFTYLIDPTLVVEARDCNGNVGTASSSFSGALSLRPGMCNKMKAPAPGIR